MVRYTPFAADGDGKSRIKAVTRSGSCRLESRFVPRGGVALPHRPVRRDPCFDNPLIEDRVVCVKAPWSRRAVVIDTPSTAATAPTAAARGRGASGPAARTA